MADPGEHLVRLRRADSDAKAARVLAVLGQWAHQTLPGGEFPESIPGGNSDGRGWEIT
jgi:hypothetical protein